MKKLKTQSLTLRKRAISKLDNLIVGGRKQASDDCTQDPQTPTEISACRTTCPSNAPTETCD